MDRAYPGECLSSCNCKPGKGYTRRRMRPDHGVYNMTISLKRISLDDFPTPLSWCISTNGHVFICGDIEEAAAQIRGKVGHEWQIAADGTVTPSVDIHCGPSMSHNWHEFVKLEGWVQCS